MSSGIAQTEIRTTISLRFICVRWGRCRSENSYRGGPKLRPIPSSVCSVRPPYSGISGVGHAEVLDPERAANKVPGFSPCLCGDFAFRSAVSCRMQTDASTETTLNYQGFLVL